MMVVSILVHVPVGYLPNSPKPGHKPANSPASGTTGDGTFKVPSSTVTTQQQSQGQIFTCYACIQKTIVRLQL